MEKILVFCTKLAAFGLIGAGVVTLVAPSVGRVLISAPVNFGTNCEPAATWAMDALIRSQLIGLIVGAIGGMGFTIWRRRRQQGDVKAPAASQ